MARAPRRRATRCCQWLAVPRWRTTSAVAPIMSEPIDCRARFGCRALPVKLSPRIGLGAPHSPSEVSATYGGRGAADRLTADATFDPSTVEGVVVQSGTSVHLEMAGRRLAYSARGAVDHVNPRRLGDALGVNGLRDERLDGSLDATFTLEGSGRTTDTLDAKADVVISNAS